MSSLKSHLEQSSEAVTDFVQYSQAMERLVAVVQALSMVRDLESIMEIVRVAARDLTGADGATFVLREGDLCYYAEENAIEPLWKGRKFPMEICISGWVMLNRQVAVIEDIYQDDRIPQDAYKPTFVKSLAMVPIRTGNPLGAIGNYWATRHQPSPQEVKLLQALADTTAVAIENVTLYNELEQKVEERTAQLKAANRELEAFSYSVSHDLRAPLRGIDGFSKLLMKKCADRLDEEAKSYLERVCDNSYKMARLIDDLLDLARITRMEIKKEPVDITALAKEVVRDLQDQYSERQVICHVSENLVVDGDPRLLKVALQNLLDNAWKYTGKKEKACIEVGSQSQGEKHIFYVKDNGAGFDMAYADKLFGAFQRLHRTDEFAGTGIGLATVARVIHRHGGEIWAEGAVEKGATFYFTLGTSLYEGGASHGNLGKEAK